MYDPYKDPTHPYCPDYQPFEEKARIAIEKRLKAEREWMEFIVAVGAGIIGETFHDRMVRTDREAEEARRQRELSGVPRRSGRDLI